MGPGDANKRHPKHIAEASPGEVVPESKGRLDTIAASVLMKVFYAARAARFGIYDAVAKLSRFITNWTVECDRRLHRIMCYIRTTLGYRMKGWAEGPPDDIDIQ